MALPTSYTLKTFQDIYTAVLEEVKIQSGDTTTLNRIKRDINLVYLEEVVPYKEWKWLRGYVTLLQQTYINAGTANVSQNSTQVTLTVAPGQSVYGYWFSPDGYSELYRIAQHTAGSTTIVLEQKYTGTTNTATNYKIWTDKIPLPVDCRATLEITHEWLNTPMEGIGMKEYRRYVAAMPKAADRPQYYTTGDYVSPAPYAPYSGLPATVSRASAGLVKTITFASDVSAIIAVGDRIEISNAGDSTYNGRYVISSVSTNVITYTGAINTFEATISDTGLTVAQRQNKTDVQRYKELWIYPSLYQTNTLLHVDYIKEPLPLINDADEPLMALEDRSVLFYGACARAWARERNPEESARNFQMFERKLGRMSGNLDDSTDQPVLRVDKMYLGSKRQMNRTRDPHSFPDGWGGSSPSGQSVTGTASRAAQFDSTGQLGASIVKTSELQQLSGIASKADGISDPNTLTNKSIDATANTLTNIGNSSIAGSAAIAYSKLNLAGSVKLTSDVTGSLPLTNIATISNNTLLGNNSGGSTTPSALTTAQVNTMLGTLSNPMTTLGDIIYEDATPTPVRLAGNTTSTKKYLSQTGTGSVSAAPSWTQPAIGDLTNIAATTIIGNNTGSPAAPIALTVAQVAALFTAPTLQKFTSTGTTTGYLFTISTSSTCAVGDTYTNNGNTYTVIAALSAQSGQVLFMSGASAPLSSGTLTRATGSGTASITYTANTPLATYTTPANVKYLRIRMMGGGGGGGGSSSTGSAGAGGSGTGTFFGALLMSANGGAGGAGAGGSGLAGSGGTASLGTGPLGIALQGATGTSSNIAGYGPPGGGSPFGGAGGGGTDTTGTNANGFSAVANTGSGGGGGGGANVGASGAAGGYVDAIITSPAATYVYAIAAGGTGGTAGTSGGVGGTGGSGLILVEEHYQ